jgi:23S rRNA (cytosine1962-C5)-methyltransferase
MKTCTLLKARKKRIEAGHPWVYANEIESIDSDIQPGELIQVFNHKGQLIGTGMYNETSQIRVRIVRYGELQDMDRDFFVTRFQQAYTHRKRFVPDETSFRAVYGEADFLPGLVVDLFAGVLVVQCLSLGMELRKAIWLDALVEVFQPIAIYERSDVAVRELEGLEQTTGLLYGELPAEILITENGLTIQVDVVQGQKTGYFFDQRENRAAIAPLIQGWGVRSDIFLQDVEGVQKPVNKNGKVVDFPYWDGATVLECFAHTGSFTLHACQYGAKKVTCLDISEHAIQSARTNVALNHFNDRVEFVTEDAFAYLRRQVEGHTIRKLRAEGKLDTAQKLTDEARSWDVIVLDPPAFAKSRHTVEAACRGYKEINLQALKLINEGGFLVTASCSYHVRPDVFLETIHAAAIDAGKQLRMIQFQGAGKDHPHLVGVEEGHYLKFGIFQVFSK